MILRKTNFFFFNCSQNITVLQILRGGGSEQFITMYFRGGGGSQNGPKKCYVIFAQPLTEILYFSFEFDILLCSCEAAQKGFLSIKCRSVLDIPTP